MKKDEITFEALKAKFGGSAKSPSRYYAKEINGNKVKEIRLQMGMTQDNFALYFGISRKTLEAWEQGNKILKGTNKLLFSIIDDFNDVKSALFKTEVAFLVGSKKSKTAKKNVKTYYSNIVHDVEQTK